MIAEFDAWFVMVLNAYARQNWLFDKSVSFLLNADSLRALPLIVILSGYWFALRDRDTHRRTIVATMIGAFVAMVITRVWQNEGPMSPRPRENPALDFVVPYGDSTNDLLATWSSFPSDTAGLTIALATGILLVNRPLGLLAIVWSLVGVCLPRIYFGLHYPSDIMVGGLVGAGAVLAAQASPLPDWLMRPVGHLERQWPGVFYACFVIAAFQISTYFWDLREASNRLLNAADGPSPVAMEADPAEEATGTTATTRRDDLVTDTLPE